MKLIYFDYNATTPIDPEVAEAMQVDLDYAMGTIRFSTDKMTTEEELNHTVAVFVKTARRLLAEKQKW